MGIDTPETVHTQKEEQPYGQEASNYTKTRLENGDKIELEYDSNSSEKDKYGRDWAWIWIDDSLLQEELVKNGLARTYIKLYWQNMVKEKRHNKYASKRYFFEV